MTFDIIDVPQRSPEWFAARLGRLTGSRAKDMLATIKSGEAAARRDLRTQLAVERLTGRTQEDGYVNAEMQRGIDLESAARDAYEALTGQIAQQTGFLQHRILMAGCSLDGHVGHFDLLVSLKCPKSATHLRYLKDGRMPPEHVPQMLHELWISGAKAYDFLSFDDRFPEPLQTFHVRIQRDDKAIAEYEAKALAFLAEVEAEVATVQKLMECAA
jgi:hypothetical protein